MSIKIYFDDNVVYLTSNLSKTYTQLATQPQTLLIENAIKKDIETFLPKVEKNEIGIAILVNTNFENLKNNFFSFFNIIEAAGGIVQNTEKEILFIKRLGKWDLPKGKIEKNELPENAALREIEEETGATKLSIINKVGETYHTYKAFDQYNLKITHWYYVKCASNDALVPQTQEDITETKWIKTEFIKEPMANTYPSIKDIMHTFFDAP